jgi:hypothetical protein
MAGSLGRRERVSGPELVLAAGAKVDMSSIHWQVLKKTVDKLINSDRSWASKLGAILGTVETGQYDQALVDAVVQKHRQRYDIYDAYCFACVLSNFVSGHLLIARIPLGQKPFADRCLAENNHALSQLEAPFTAEFWGGKSDEDGYLEWSTNIELQRGPSSAQAEQYTLPPARVPLEVGYTDASCTHMHLCSAPGLARWPYESKQVWLFWTIGDDVYWNATQRRISAFFGLTDSHHRT